MATLGDMRTRIADELQIDATAYAVEIDRAIFSSIAFYNDKDFDFLEAAPTVLTISATVAYPLLSAIPDRSEIKEIQLHLNNSHFTLDYRPFSVMVDWDWSDENEGDPSWWTIWNDELRFDSYPNQTRTAVVWHTLRRSMDPDADATSVWTNEAEELIRLHAEVDLLENRIKDYEDAGRKRGREAEVLTNLNEKTVTRKSMRRVRPYL